MSKISKGNWLVANRIKKLKYKEPLSRVPFIWTRLEENSRVYRKMTKANSLYYKLLESKVKEEVRLLRKLRIDKFLIDEKMKKIKPIS